MRRLLGVGGFLLPLFVHAALLTGACRAQELAQAPPAGISPPGEAAAAGADWPKYVLSGSRARFHLIGSVGTVHYWLWGGHSGCCGGAWYLAKLRHVNSSPWYLYVQSYYTSPSGHTHTEYWAIARHESFCKHYEVFRYTSTGYESFGYFRLSCPK